MFQVSANTTTGCFDMCVSSSPSNKIICSFLVHLLLLLATEILNVNDNMIYKWVRSVQILTLVALMLAYLPCPAIRPFIHFLVRFLLILSIETYNVNEDMVFKSVRLVQMLQSLMLDVLCVRVFLAQQ